MVLNASAVQALVAIVWETLVVRWYGKNLVQCIKKKLALIVCETLLVRWYARTDLAFAAAIYESKIFTLCV